MVVEIYLRNGAWKVRAVGQGYANGLAGIATDFGVSVEEPAAPAQPVTLGPAGRAARSPAAAPQAPPAPAAPRPRPPPRPAPARSTWTRGGSASRRTRRSP